MSANNAMPDEGSLLDALQKESFEYFRREVNHTNGLIPDKSAQDTPASSTAVGMALACYPVAVERGLLGRDEAVQRTLTTLRFFRDSSQSDEPISSGYRGFYYHFLDMASGRRAWKCELSTIDSTFLIAGALVAAQYFDGAREDEQEVRYIADELYRRMDWTWMLTQEQTVGHGWKPEAGFLPHSWQGYSEALLLYLLGLGSPTHPLPAESYRAWVASYRWKKIYGRDLLFAGPLFIHQLSHIWVDFRGIRDEFMREKGSDYFENSRRAGYVQQEYARRNPRGFAGYGEMCWGITACDGPGPVTKPIDGVQRKFYDYVARGAPYGPDDGTLAPWAVVASLPFAPEIVLPTIKHFRAMKLHEHSPFGLRASFNLTFDKRSGEVGWRSPWHFGLNQGPIMLMVENYRSGMIWELMRRSPYLRLGLRRAGFTGGWLDK